MNSIYIALITIVLMFSGCGTQAEVSTEQKVATESQQGALSGMSDQVPPKEQEYIDTVLSKITIQTTKEETVALLGTPSRDLGLKVNWWVEIDGKKSRVGVYFSSDGKANEIVLDGGTGRFYFRKELKE